MTTSRQHTYLVLGLKAVSITIICLLAMATPGISNALSHWTPSDTYLQKQNALSPIAGTLLNVDHKADAKAVVDKLASGDLEGIRKSFNAQMKANLSAEKMKAG